jgi:hypothetical protein
VETVFGQRTISDAQNYQPLLGARKQKLTTTVDSLTAFPAAQRM